MPHSGPKLSHSTYPDRNLPYPPKNPPLRASPPSKTSPFAKMGIKKSKLLKNKVYLTI